MFITETEKFYNDNPLLIENLKKKVVFNDPLFRIISILPVGHYCNYNCNYCKFHDNNERYLDKDRLKKFLEKILNYTVNNPNFLFTGGNPLLYPNLNELFNIIIDKCNKFNKKPTIILYITNFSIDILKKWKNDYKGILKFSSSYDISFPLKSKEKMIDFISQYDDSEIVLQFDKNTNLDILENKIQKYWNNSPSLRLTYGGNIPNVKYFKNLIDILQKYKHIPISPTFDYILLNPKKQYTYPKMFIKNKVYISPATTSLVFKIVAGISPNYYTSCVFEKLKTQNLSDIINVNKTYFNELYKTAIPEKCNNCSLKYLCFVCPFYKEYCNDGLKYWIRYLLKLTEELINDYKNESIQI